MNPELEGPTLLRTHLDRLAWSPERLAREVNRLVGENVVSSKAPYGWLKGAVPRGRLPQFVALALGRALGEPITPASIWPRSRAGGVAMAAHHGLDLPWTSEGALACAGLVSVPTGNALMPVSGPMLVALAVDWLTVPASAAPTRTSGEPLNPAIVAVLGERIIQLRRLDDTQASPLLLELVTRDLRLAADLAAAASYDPATGVALFDVLAQLGQLAGWIAIDLDRRALGQRFLLAALRFAHAAGDRELAANVLSCLGYQTLWAGDGASAVRLVRLARQGTLHFAHPRVAALLASREGRAHATNGDLGACAQALDEAAAAFEQLDCHSDPGPAWSYWITGGVLAADAGRAWLEAGVADRAVELLTTGLLALPVDQPRNLLLHRVSLAHAHLQLGQPDAAVDVGLAALDAAQAMGSSRVRSRLVGLQGELTTSGSRAATALADQIAGLLNK